MFLQFLLVLPIFTALSCLAVDAFVRRYSYFSVFADLTSLKHLSYIQNLDDENDGTGVIAFDTSRLGLWLSDLLLDDSSVILLYLVLC